jgi:hypothetical protein
MLISAWAGAAAEQAARHQDSHLGVGVGERDAEAGRAVEDEPIDKLIAAFDAWVASLSPVSG